MNVLHWQCVASVCGIQAADACADKTAKEKTNHVVITVIEGSASVKDIEEEFNGFFKKPKWRCTARPVGPNQFTMRFPNADEVERAVYYGQHMKMRTTDVVLRISAWTPEWELLDRYIRLG